MPIIASISAGLLVSAALVSATFRPLRNTVTVSETRRMSSMKCEMKTMLVPSSRSCLSVANRRSTSGGDSAEVGSSRMMIRAPGKYTGDLDQLLQADRQVAEPRHRIDVDAEPFQLLAGFARHAPPLHEPKRLVGWLPRNTFSATVRSGATLSS